MNVIELILLIFPAYVANSIPIIFGGGKPIDFGKHFAGARLFGSSKTIRGFLSGVAFGALSGVALVLVLGDFYLPQLGGGQKIILATALSLGAMCGDVAGSFVKRRLGMPPGFQSLLLDQLPFLFFALAFGWLVWSPLLAAIGLLGVGFLSLLTIALHLFFNVVANKLGLKKVPW